MSTTHDASSGFTQRPRPRFLLPFLVEGGGGSLFARFGRIEVYARPERPRAWFILREPGSVEVSAGPFRITVARVPASRQGTAHT